MTQFGFLIDNRKCIGCHACSTACKSENEVAVGVNRTWVKYTEKGVFPDTRRYFQVTRCNHCANPPCVYICPVTAMYQRPDGIVEFDPALCIGCKACMQACPYDAIYIDPDSGTAAKCHFCAHRTEVGLEPACVIVCPEHAILAGDLDDANSEISRAVATQQVRVRKPEQGTKPKLFYIDAEETSIVPTLAAQDQGMLWATWPDHGAGDWRGPIQFGEGNMAGALMRTAAAPRETYNVPHKIPWHWQVPAYLVAKSIGAGAFIVAAVGVALGLLPPTPLFTTIAAFVSLLFIGINTGLLVWDLDRPDRFWTILIRPQWRSWLARGAFILIGFSAVGGLYFLGQLANLPISNLLVWPGVVLAVLSAIYTAFLFAQAEGRDLWQSTLLPWHLFVQAIMAGSAALLIVGPFVGLTAEAARPLVWTFGLSLLVNLLITWGGEFAVPHASQVAAMAAHMITGGKYSRWYRASLIGGLVVPLVIVALPDPSVFAYSLAGLLSLAGLFAYEWVFVMAPQDVPNN
ncbi:MAG: polysulfide reductase NrfD [Chloroflexi bacterium]|nr:polysulfide reductase NrfD [Chloroflexota bacterium]